MVTSTFMPTVASTNPGVQKPSLQVHKQPYFQLFSIFVRTFLLLPHDQTRANSSWVSSHR